MATIFIAIQQQKSITKLSVSHFIHVMSEYPHGSLCPFDVKYKLFLNRIGDVRSKICKYRADWMTVNLFVLR